MGPVSGLQLEETSGGGIVAPFSTGSPMEVGGAAGDPLASAVARGLDHSGRSERVSWSPRESIHGHTSPDAVSWGAPRPADDRNRGPISDAGERLHDLGGRRPQEEGWHARPDERRIDGGPGGYRALSRRSIEARIYSRELAESTRRR